jgi:hypothetical protein
MHHWKVGWGRSQAAMALKAHQLVASQPVAVNSDDAPE